jgi:hypothetical protein
MGRAIQQNAQMMNMMSQQRAAERQAAQAAQEMELARAAEGRAVTAEERAAREAQQEYMATEVTRLRNRGAAVGDDAGYQMWLSQVEQVSPNDAALFRQYSPTFDADKMKNILMEADKFIDKNIATPLASLQYGEDGRAFGVTVGGMGSPRAQEVIVQPPAGAQAALPQPPQTTPTPPFDDKIETAARAILKGAGIGNSAIRALTPEEFDRAADRADELKSAIRDNRVQPVSMTTGPQTGAQPDLAAVVQDMMSSGQVSQANLQLMRDTAGPANDAQLAEILRANNIRIVPDDEPTMRSAVFRPGEDAAPQMQQVQQVQAINRPGTQFRGKDPMQSPSQAPSSAGAVAGATTAASEGVRVQTQPTITAREERVRRVEKLRGELPRARADAQALITDLDERIKAIDEFLRSPYRNSIIGAVEGRIPRMLQTPARADAQALYDSIKDNTTLTRLLSDRSQTETGASPMGIVSDRDVDMVARGATRLTQTGTESQQEREMQRLRDTMFKTRQLAIETYNNVYREVLPEAPNLKLRVPSIAPKYRAKPGTPTQGKSQLSPEVAKKYGL